MKRFLFFFVVSFFATLSHGYQFAYSDQEIVIPYIIKIKDPSLFRGDLLFSQPSSTVSIFYYVYGFLSKFFDLQILFFISYLLIQTFFFILIFHLSRILLKNSKIAYLSVLPFILPKFIGGTAVTTFDTFFGYRSFGVLFLLLYLIILLKNRYYLASLVAGLSLWVHPLSILPNIFLLPLSIVFNSKNKRKDLIISLTIFALAISPFLLLLSSKTLHQVDRSYLDRSWFEIIKVRNPSLFLSSWSTYAWLSVGLFLTLILITFKNLEKKLKKILLIYFLGACMMFALNLLIFEVIKIPFTAQLQLYRSLQPIAYLSLLLSPLLLFQKNKLIQTIGILAFVSLCLNFYLVLGPLIIIFLVLTLKNRQGLLRPSTKTVSLFFALIVLLLTANIYRSVKNQYIQFPKPKNDWQEIQIWAEKNTSKSDKFLVDPKNTGFRTFSHRAIVGDVKDGAVAIYSPQYATYWSSLMRDTANYESLNEQDFSFLKKKYFFNYLITKTNQKVNLEIIYMNNSYTLYKI